MNRPVILFALVFVGVIIASGMLFAPVLGEWMDDRPGGALTPQIAVQVSFDDATETVRLTHDGGDVLREGIEVRVLVCPVGSDSPANATLIHNETTVTNGLWVSSEHRAAAPYPLRLGDSVQVLSDGVDSDSDGTAGIESGETLVVKIVNTEADPKAERIVLNETIEHEAARPCLLA